MRISISQLNRMKRNTTRSRAPLMVEQVFSIDAPGALRVQLAGNFTRWEMYAISMSRGQDGIWRCKVDLAPGTYHYRFIVDGEWRDDPECTVRIPNQFGTANMIRTVAPVGK